MVVESGVDGDWEYKKYADGTAEAWYRGNYGNIDLETVLGTDIVSNAIIFQFPFTFKEIPVCIIGYEGNDIGYATLQNPGGITSKTTTSRSHSVRLCRIGTAKATLTNNIFTCYVRGKYK